MPLTVIGASDGLPLKIDAGGRVRYVSDGFFMADVDAFPSNSGSPVIATATGELVGVLIGGAMADFRRGPDGKKRYEVVPEKALEDMPGEYVLSVARIRQLMEENAATQFPPKRIKAPAARTTVKNPSF